MEGPEAVEFGSLLKRLNEEHRRVVLECLALQKEVEGLRTHSGADEGANNNVAVKPPEQFQFLADTLELSLRSKDASVLGEARPTTAEGSRKLVPMMPTSSSISLSNSVGPRRSLGPRHNGAQSPTGRQQRSAPLIQERRPRLLRQDALTFSSRGSDDASNPVGRTGSLASSEQEFNLQACWREDAPPRRFTGGSASSSPSTLDDEVFDWASGNQNLDNWTTGDQPRMNHDQRAGCLKCIIADPSSPLRLTWDLMGAVLIGWDLVRIPLIVFDDALTRGGGQVEESEIDGFELFVSIFWTVNIFMSLTVGYVEKGNTVVNPTGILIQYLKTWFIPDMVVVVPDWIFMIAFWTASGERNATDRVWGLLRILRLIRMVRLLRVLKLMRVVREINERISSQHMAIISNVVKMVIVLVVINHWIASAWYLIGVKAGYPESWVTEYIPDSTDPRYQYFTALHWALTQFTPASMNVQPTNLTERSFTVVVVVVAVITYSYILGSMTSSLGQLRELQSAYYKNFWDLRRYLMHNKVDPELSSRVQNYLEHAWQSQNQRLSIDRVKVLEMLSEELYNELKFQLVVPHLTIHPFFDSLCQSSKVTVQRLARLAIHHMHYAHGDNIFFPQEQASHMYILVSGGLTYMDVLFRQSNVDAGEQWVSEMALWLESWLHLGGLQTTVESELLLIEPSAFQKSAARNPRAFWLCSVYAKRLVSVLKRKPQEHLSDIMSGHSQEMQIVMSQLWAEHQAPAAEDSAEMMRFIIGNWVDQERDFFGGSIIEFTEHGWRPRHGHRGHDKNRYEWIPHPDKVELIEQRTNGAFRKFDLRRGDDDHTVVVSINFEGTVKQWHLVRSPVPKSPLRGLFSRSSGRPSFEPRSPKNSASAQRSRHSGRPARSPHASSHLSLPESAESSVQARDPLEETTHPTLEPTVAERSEATIAV